MATTLKKCSKCIQFKPVTEYYKDNQKKDGLRSNCKACVKRKKQGASKETGFYKVVKNPILDERK